MHETYQTLYANISKVVHISCSRPKHGVHFHATASIPGHKPSPAKTCKLVTNRLPKCYVRHSMFRMSKAADRRDLFAGALELMVLHSLRLKPMHGYALVKHIQHVSGDLLAIEEGSLYPALQRMLREGWLEAEPGISAKGRPTRTYRLTRAGLKRLRQEKSSFEQMFAGIHRVLAVAKI